MSVSNSGSSVSVIIPVKNAERYLREALESVTAQTHAPGEVVVVDGASTDRSAAIAAAFSGVRMIQQEGEGLAAALNTGVRRSTCGLITFLSSDDRWLPRKLEKQVAFFVANPGAELLITRMRWFVDEGGALPSGFRRELLEDDVIGRVPETLMCRRAAFERIGLFDPRYRLAMDSDWFARAKDQGLRLDLLDETLVQKRIHARNLSHSDVTVQNRELLALLRQSVKRQRRESDTTEVSEADAAAPKGD